MEILKKLISSKYLIEPLTKFFPKSIPFVRSSLKPEASVVANLKKLLKSNEDVKDMVAMEAVTESERKQLLKLVKNSYLTDEPLCRFLKMDFDPEVGVYCLSSLKEGCSYKAVNSDGRMIGFLINGYRTKDVPDSVKEAKSSLEVKNPKLQKLVDFSSFVDEQFNIFSIYPDLEKVLESKVFAVDAKYRDKYIEGLLTMKSLNQMKEENIKVMVCSCTSYKLAKMLETFGFREVFRIDFKDYQVNGKVVFSPPAPDVSNRIMVIEN